MFVKQVIQTPQGTVKFEGELSQEETEFVIGVGLNWLLQNGTFAPKSPQEQH